MKGGEAARQNDNRGQAGPPESWSLQAADGFKNPGER